MVVIVSRAEVVPWTAVGLRGVVAIVDMGDDIAAAVGRHHCGHAVLEPGDHGAPIAHHESRPRRTAVVGRVRTGCQLWVRAVKRLADLDVVLIRCRELVVALEIAEFRQRVELLERRQRRRILGKRERLRPRGRVRARGNIRESHVVELGVDEERTARQRASLEEAATAEGAAKDSITHASPRGLRARALNQPIE